MRRSFLVMVFLGKGKQMENTGNLEPAAVRQQVSTGVAEQTRREPGDTDCDVSRILRAKRWEQREGPFQGFDSPEGKF
jgi:hypothetical protein